MKSIFTKLLFLNVLIVLIGCGPSYNPQELQDYTRNKLNSLNDQLTQVIISDIFTPPVASRIYVYSHIAAYEALRHDSPEYQSLAGQLNELGEFPQPQPELDYYFPVASLVAFVETGKQLVYNQEMLEKKLESILNEVKEIGIEKERLQNSIDYGKLVANHILSWAKTDGYIERQALPRYILLNEPGKWQPTPPDYMPGIEPHWNTIRPLVLDSAGQFPPPPPTAFDTTKNSLFFQECLEVYNAVKANDNDKIEIAKFWDCNPNISFTKGHVMFYHQKISPGGHWLSIASIVSQMENLPLMERSMTFTFTAISLFDGFISCWDEKYRSSLIRPETYIDLYIDPDWKPILQTPAFPEYTSGHSVISAAAATTLTHILGDQYAFADSSEVSFGLPVRNFSSFFHASNEAAISRLYGGIHYRPAIDNGVAQGKKVGSLVTKKLKFREDLPLARKHNPLPESGQKEMSLVDTKQ
jgi:hypothetical protein